MRYLIGLGIFVFVGFVYISSRDQQSGRRGAVDEIGIFGNLFFA